MNGVQKLYFKLFPPPPHSKNSFKNTIRVSNRLDPDQARNFVGPDLGSNCLQQVSANTRVKPENAKLTLTNNLAVNYNECDDNYVDINSYPANHVLS